MRIFIFTVVILFGRLTAQVGINTTTPHSSAKLDINSTTKGLLLPRLTNSQMLAISNPAAGLEIFNTSAGVPHIFNGTSWNSQENRIATYVNAGVTVQLDNLKVRLSTITNERSLQIATVSGNINVSGGSMNFKPSSAVSAGGTVGTVTGWTRQSNTIGTSFVTWETNGHFGAHGSVQKIEIMDETNKRAYRCILIVGNSYLNNFISIERIL